MILLTDHPLINGNLLTTVLLGQMFSEHDGSRLSDASVTRSYRSLRRKAIVFVKQLLPDP